jgi:hypothetical protein
MIACRETSPTKGPEAGTCGLQGVACNVRDGTIRCPEERNWSARCGGGSVRQRRGLIVSRRAVNA